MAHASQVGESICVRIPGLMGSRVSNIVGVFQRSPISTLLLTMLHDEVSGEVGAALVKWEAVSDPREQFWSGFIKSLRGVSTHYGRSTGSS